MRSLRVVPPSSSPPSAEPIALSDRAMENLQYIRSTMDRAGRFTAIPGWGLVMIGATALLASFAASQWGGAAPWLFTWLGEAVLAFALGIGTALLKARRTGQSLRSGPGRKMLFSLLPALLAGALLTHFLLTLDVLYALPGLWLLLYGAGMTAAGTNSVASVPVMGMCFILLGALALLLPGVHPDIWMGLGFGALHIVFGVFIARRHGG